MRTLQRPIQQARSPQLPPKTDQKNNKRQRNTLRVQQTQSKRSRTTKILTKHLRQMATIQNKRVNKMSSPIMTKCTTCPKRIRLHDQHQQCLHCRQQRFHEIIQNTKTKTGEDQ